MDSLILQKLKFHPIVQEWFLRKFNRPSPPQLQGWPKIASGKHTLILAPTGSGKTLAAFMWCIDELVKNAINTPKAKFEQNIQGVHTLYISPLKALNNDIHVNLQDPLQGILTTAASHSIALPGIRTAVRTGDTPSHVRQAMVKKPPHILITTPESLYLLLTSEKGRDIFPNLRYVIIDEIHAVCNNKRGVHLCLSLERLNVLCKNPPVRIGLSATQRPLNKIAAFLGGQDIDTDNRTIARPVSIVDCGQRKEIHLAVKAPVADYTDLPDASVWPGVINTLYELIQSHRNTLIFANMRAKTEKVARQLNERFQKESNNPNAQLILAHHGSISREMRYDIEAKLKSGNIPAVIATSSLELGIDIGSIDLVVHLQTPENVASGLQRVGRSGHLLSAKSKGIIIPLFQNDLDDAVSVAAAMLKGEIEETHIPENCLDVLAQQIVAELSMRSYQRLELLTLIRQSYCYRHLSENLFNNVIEMLSGKFADGTMRALQPRIHWDRVNDELIARKGARLLAVMSGGTIADRGYYGVYLQGSTTRLGEVEEEFVFESRVGDVFFLGNNEWRIDEITRDRIIVTPRSSTKPRPPFWKAEPAFKSIETCQRVGALRRQLEEKSDILASSKVEIDTTIRDSLDKHLQRQIELTQKLPTDKRIIVEYFRDSAGEPHILVHTTFGGRVNGAWATALGSQLEKKYGAQIQFTFNDDGILFRLYDEAAEPNFEKLFQLTDKEIKKLLIDAIANTPLFYVRFRQNATRALLLQRSTVAKRIPLWLQRLRAADLLNTVRAYPEFPLLIETYRDCLEDVFDLTALLKIIHDIHADQIKIEFIETPYPSPMASGLLFNMVSQHMYDYDRQRIPGFAAQVSNELLADILSKSEIPCIITIEMCAKAEAFWQHLHPDRQARDEEDLFEIIEQLEPITTTELARRAHQAPESWLHKLSNSKRIMLKDGSSWSVASNMNQEEKKPQDLVAKYLRFTAPKTISEIAHATGLSADETTAALQKLLQEKNIVRGKLVIGKEAELWCDRENFAHLYRKAIAERRKSYEPADRQTLYKFLFAWHRIHSDTLSAFFERYMGYAFPLYLPERDILNSRMHDQPNIDTLINDGNVFAFGRQSKERGRYSIQFIPRGKGSTFFSKQQIKESLLNFDATVQPIIAFLRENGASQHRDISEATGKSSHQVDQALSILVKSGLVSCDDYESLPAILQAEASPESHSQSSWHDEIKPAWSMPRTGMQRRSRPSRQNIQNRMRTRQGLWFLVDTFAVFGKSIDEHTQAERQARMLLERYGVLVKEFYRKEQGLLAWHTLFKVLKKMEWSGEIRRGYFIKGLSGVQFATEEALQTLQNVQLENKNETKPVLLSTMDPALPFGGFIPWSLKYAEQDLKITKSAANHLYFENAAATAYLENYAGRITILQDTIDLPSLIQHIKSWLTLPAASRPRKKIELQFINEQPAYSSEYHHIFIQNGFERLGDKLVLWPSSAQKE